MRRQYQSNEAGLVSILTVMFLMVFLSILIVGFIKIVGDEQRQATDNDLSASALAAAQSGIEDGKRILLYCRDNSGAPCDRMLNSGNGGGDCSAFTDNTTNGVMNPLGINRDAANGAQVGATDFQQFYTCLTIQNDTQDIQQVIKEGRGDVQRLKVKAPGNLAGGLKVSWSPSDTSVKYASHANNLLFSTDTAWKNVSNNRYPPIVRMQFIPFSEGAIDLDTVERESRTIFLVPGAAGAPASIGLGADNRSPTVGPLRPTPTISGGNVACIAPPAGSYNCSIVVNGFVATKEYYVRTSVLYSGGGRTNVTLALTDTAQKFNGVQPIIDATGRTNDVFRRVKARVGFQAPGIAFPEYALESASQYCKSITVADAAYSSYNCP